MSDGPAGRHSAPDGNGDGPGGDDIAGGGGMADDGMSGGAWWAGDGMSGGDGTVGDGMSGGDGTAGDGSVGDGSDTAARGHRAPRGRRRDPDRPRDPVRTTVRGVGQLLITAGVVVLLFVVYEVFVTNLFGEQKQAGATAALNKLWASQSDVVTDPGDAVVKEPGGTVVVTAPGGVHPADRQRHYNTTEGAGFAKMYIPSFGSDFVLTVIEGTDQADLYAGPGHYLGTQYPGQPGNFAVAGHRVNKGAPFDDLGLLHSCDAIVVETVDDWYVYRVLPMSDEVADWSKVSHPHCEGVTVQQGEYRGVFGRDITLPTDIAQIRPVPHVNSTVVPPKAESLITLTTCNPKFSDTQRMIIHGILVKSYPKKAGFLPPQLQETT